MEMGESGIGVLRLPASVQFGTGARAAAPRELAAIGRRVVAIVDPFLATTPAFIELIDQVTAGGLEVVVRTDVQPELPVDSLAELAADVHGFSPDVVLGYGGGSALDAAKLVALLLAHGGPLSRYYGEERGAGPRAADRRHPDHRGHRVGGDPRGRGRGLGARAEGGHLEPVPDP